MKVSVVVPLLNEQDNLRPLHARLVATLEGLGVEREIIFVDDGSTDASLRVIEELAAADPHVIGLSFARNFGHEPASTAGLDVATGDVAVLMDADLQDPPELIGEMIAKWREGNRIVYATRKHRAGESIFKRSTSWLFYRMLNWFSEVDIPMDTGDFRLVDRRVLEALRAMRETDRFVRGLVAWTGFKSAQVFYDRPARHSGETKYRPLKLLLLSLDAIVGFSITPLRMATILGLCVCVFSVALVFVLLLQRLVFGHQFPMQGYALLASGLFFLGGTQILLLGVIGEYIGRIYRREQDRPLYLIDTQVGAAAEARRR
jgi:glycosyltransferase involved in cell wall biosynthesis